MARPSVSARPGGRGWRSVAAPERGARGGDASLRRREGKARVSKTGNRRRDEALRLKNGTKTTRTSRRVRGDAGRAGRAQEAACIAQRCGLGGARGHPALAPQGRFLRESADVRWAARVRRVRGGWEATTVGAVGAVAVRRTGRARDVPRRGTRCCRTWASCSGVERAEANVERRRSVSSSHERWSRVVRIAAAPRVHAPVSLAPAAKRQVDAPDTPTISRDGARPQRAL